MISPTIDMRRAIGPRLRKTFAVAESAGTPIEDEIAAACRRIDAARSRKAPRRKSARPGIR